MHFIKITIPLVLVAFSGLCSAALESEDFPLLAELTGNNVYIRSGPGTAWYFTGKISQPERVTAVGKKYGWTKIVPPKGSFSWISKAYVTPDPAEAGYGIVTGDGVKVYAGSPNVQPQDSSSLQTKMYKGDRVKLTGEEKNDYYKIEPPKDAYLWVSSQYLKFVKALDEVGAQAEKVSEVKYEVPEPEDDKDAPQPEPEPADDTAKQEQAPPDAVETATEPEQETEQTVETAPKPQPEVAEQAQAPEPKTPAELDAAAGKSDAEMVKMCLALENMVDDELMKPLEQQDYKPIKDKLAEIQNASGADSKGHRYAKYLLDRIGRYELVINVDKALAEHDKELEKTREQIEQQRQEKVGNIPDPGRYIVTGILKESSIYTEASGQKRYLLMDDYGKIISYVVPDKGVSMDMDKFINERVNVIGRLTEDSSSPMSLVRFVDLKYAETPEMD